MWEFDSFHPTQVPFLQGPIDEIVSAQTEKALTQVLEKFDSPHHFERPEERYLLNWYKVLNRFDELLERYVSERNIFTKPSSSKQSPKSPQKATPPKNDTIEPATQIGAPSEFPLNPAMPEASGASAVDATPAKRDSETEKKTVLFSPSPSLIRLVLRVSQRLLRNASHDTRNLYHSVEHLGALLADEHSAIVLLTLEILNMLMQRSHKIRATRTQITFELSERLLDLALGWGGRENRLGLLECCSSKDTELLPADGSRLFFEFTTSKSSSSNPTVQSSEERPQRRERQPGTGPAENAGKKSILQIPPRNSAAPIPLSLASARANIPPDEEPVVSTSGSINTIVIDDVSSFHGTERWLLSDFALRHNVPKTKLFSLLSAFRRAKTFSGGREDRIELAVVRLYALTTLFQLQPVPSRLNDLLAKEPELTQDIIALASANSRDGVQDIPSCLRVIAIRCLTAMSADRHRVALILSTNGVSVHHGALPTLLRTEIAHLLSSSNDLQGTVDKILPDIVSTEGSEPQIGSSTGGRNSKGLGTLTLFGECNRVSPVVQRIHMTESLLALVHSLAVAAGSSGATPLANSGVLSTLIPLLTDADVRHARVVSQAIRAMQAIVEGSAQTLGCQLFRDHDGLALVAERIALEVGLDDASQSEGERDRNDEAVEVDSLQRRGESRALYERLGRRQMSPLEALEHPPPSSSTASRGLLPHSKWALIRTLHQLLLRALGNGGNEVRELVVGSKLPQALRKIMAQPFLHGGSLFQSAANVTTEIAHAEPTATAELVKAGLASTVLKSISLGLPPCGEAVRCIPNLLAALCLAPSARDVIVNSKPLKLYLLRLATPFYTRALHGETPVLIGSALDELMRHVEALRPDGNEAMIEYLRLSAKFVETDTKAFKRSARPGSNSGNSVRANNLPGDDMPTPMDKGSASPSNPASTRGDQESTSPDAILLDRMKLAVANNSCRLAGFAQGSSEHQQGIVQNGGLEHMIQLRYAPASASTEASIREGYSSSRHYPTPALTVVSLVTALKNFSSRHAASVLKSLFTVILKDAATVLKIAKELDDRWLPQEDDRFLAGTGLKSSKARGTDPVMTCASDSQLDSPPQSGDDIGTEEALKNSGDKSDVPRPSKVTSIGKTGAVETDSHRAHLRKKMSESLKKLRVGVVLLTGLPRGGSGTSAGVWESARGSHVAAIVSTVERAARCHLAIVFTGLTLSASSDGDLSTARVTAAADPELKTLRPELCAESLGDSNKAFGFHVTTNPLFVEACKRYKVPPEGHGPVRQDVKGLAWCLVTFAVAAQRLYSILSKGLTYSSRRLSRDPARYAASAKSLAATIGRIFALHLMAAVPLWDVKVITMGRNRVVAAWDYVRGILIEIKGTLFDESHRVTQTLILKSFLDAGGAEALMQATQPFLIVQAASPVHVFNSGGTAPTALKEKSQQELDKILKNSSISISSYLLALGDVYNQLPEPKSSNILRTALAVELPSDVEKEDTDMSSDSVSNQARAISRIVVSESDLRRENQSEGSGDDLVGNEDLLSILECESKRNALKLQTERLTDIALTHCENVAMRRVASDVWNTLCGFLHLLGSCPGLLNSSSSPIPEPSGTQNEWEPRDIQRSALTVTLQLLTTVTTHPVELLAAFRPEGSAMADLLGLIHTTSQVAGELCQKTDVNEAGGNRPEEFDAFLERQVEAGSARQISPDPDMLRSLVEMGFSERRAAYALRHTAPGGIEYAAEWLLSHREDDDDSVHSDEAEEGRDWEHGADEQEDEGDGDAEAEDDENAENDEDNDGEEILEGERVGSSGQNSDVAEDAAMEDTAQGGASDSGDIATSTPSREPSPRPTPTERRNRGRGTGRSKQKSHKSKSLESKGKEVTLNVAADKDGPRLLEISLSHELKLLSAALEKSKIVPDSDIQIHCSLARTHIGLTIGTPEFLKDDYQKGSNVSVRTVSTAVDSFTTTKKDLFQSLLNVARFVIRGCEEHSYGRHLPYLAIELLSIIQKDGTLVHEGSEFAGLLDKGLRLALDEQQISEEGVSALCGQTAAIWSHYGGNHARRALQKCGTFRLAYDCLAKTVGDWESSMTGPLVDIEATQPIKNLSITEDERSLDPTLADVILKDSSQDGKHFEKLSATRKTVLRPVTRKEAVRLKQLTTCLLLLDASIRFEAMDRVIECCKATEQAKGDVSGQPAKAPGNKEGEKMDTDENPNDDSAGIERGIDSSDGGTMNGEANKALGEVMRDIFGTTPSAMEIDAKSVDEGEVELVFIRNAAKETKADFVSKVKKQIANWMTTKAGDGISTVFSKEGLLGMCLTLLKLWKGAEVGDALLAVLQVLASLTSNWHLAQTAIEGGVIAMLLELPHLEAGQSRSTDVRVVRLLTKTILRHLIEDPATLQEAMVAELRSVFSSGQSRARPAYSMKTLISSTSPMVARDLQCYISALTTAVRACESERRGELQLVEYKLLSTSEIEPILDGRPNVRHVVAAVSSLITDSRIGDVSHDIDSHYSTPGVRNRGGSGLARYALELLADFIEFAQVAAVAFIKTPSPSPEVPGSTLDHIIQRVLPLRAAQEERSGTALSMSRLSPEREEMSNAARKVFLALCSRTANTHEEAVGALAKAAKLEADEREACPGVIAGLAQCIAPGTKLRVLRVVLETEMANDLARSLRTLDLSIERNFEVASIVLRALSLIGQAATYLARHGDETTDDVPFGSNNARDPWGSLREREDGLGHSGSFMVL